MGCFILTAGQLCKSCSNCARLEVTLSSPQQFSWLSRSVFVLFSKIPQAEFRSISWRSKQDTKKKSTGETKSMASY